MTRKKAPGEKHRIVAVTYRFDQEEKIKALQAERRLSRIFQEAVDAATI